MSTLGLLRKATMPWVSAMKFYKWMPVKKCLKTTERRVYIERSEELRIATMLRGERENFFVVTGPKKVGKSYMLMHMADTSLHKHALYLKLEQNITNVDEVYQRIAKKLGYHQLYEESLLGAFLFPWKMLQPTNAGHVELAEYLKDVGRKYQRLNKGALPILIIDDVAPLAKGGSQSLEFLAYMAKSLIVSRSMIFVFGLLDAFGPNVLSNSGYAMNKETVYLNYISQREMMTYAVRMLPKSHPLKQKFLQTIAKENKRIYGSNFQYVDLLLYQLAHANSEEDIEKARKFTEDKVIFDIGDEMKKTFFKDQTVPESSAKMSLIKAFDALRKKGKMSFDIYLSFFNRTDQPLASQFLYNFMILKEQRDMVTFRGPPVQYYIEKKVLSKYATSITQEDEIKLQKDIQEYKAFIEDTAILQPVNFKWSDLIGMDSVKQKIMETIIFPTLNPALFTGLRAPARGVMFYGPPGTGKTMTAKVIASEFGKGITFFSVSPSTFSAQPFNSDPDKIVKALFSVASERQPAIIFIDEIDLIMSKRGPEDTERSRRLKNEFLIQFHGMLSGQQDRVVVIGATSKVANIDDAILRRFPVRIGLDLPSPQSRKQMVKSMVEKVKREMSEKDYDAVVERTGGFSFADLAEVCREASYEPIRELPVAQLVKVKAADVRPIVLKDFHTVLDRLARKTSEESKCEKCQVDE